MIWFLDFSHQSWRLRVSFSLRESRRPSPRSRNLWFIGELFSSPILSKWLNWLSKRTSKPWRCFFWATWWLLSFTTGTKINFSLIFYNVAPLTHLSPCPGFDLSLPFFCRSISSSTPWGGPWSTPSPSRWGTPPSPPTCSKPLYPPTPPSSRNCTVPFPIDRHYFSLCSVKAAEALEPIFSRPTVSLAVQTFSLNHSEIRQEI